MSKGDEWMPQLENDGEMMPDDGLDDLFMYENQVPTQASIALTIFSTDMGKKKSEEEAVRMVGEYIEDDEGLVHEWSDDDDPADDDYNPAADDDEYAAYGVDDNILFDWMIEQEGERAYVAEERVIEGPGEGREQFSDEVDNEQMFGAIDSDKELIGYECNSDDEERNRHKYPEFNPEVDMRNPKFCKGMLFATPKILKEAIRERAIQNGWEPLFYKVDKSRLRCICKGEGCEYELYASKMQHENTIQIKKYKPNHTCARIHVNTTVRVPYLVQRFSDMIKLNPTISTKALQNTMAAKIRANVSFQQAYRTKRAALELLERSMKEQYARVQDYAHELKRVDSNTTVDIKCDFNNPQQLPVFKRMYICLGALKMGFKAGCRPLLGLDGCHLKSAYGGQLLSAVGLDANNSTYVVAYAMVEQESKDSWEWFLRLLRNDLDITGEGNGFTFITDKQKGLIPACGNVFPFAEHRFCVRHLWTNFNKLFPGKAYKDGLWAIAKSTTMTYYHANMTLMNQTNPGAYAWLNDTQRPPKHWCRAHFSTVLKCDMLLNNLCESFNAFILPARPKPVISCFEDIRMKMMKRIATRREKMSKVMDTLCPKPRELLEKNKVKASTDCIPHGTGTPVIKVEGFGGSYVVDLTRRMCACRRWDLTGLPCKHAISAIHFMRQKPEDYVDACYLKSTYMVIYSHIVQPVNGMDLWIPIDEADILPPQYNRQPGRPKTKRIKDASEKETDGPKLGRIQKSLKCSNCSVLGHNKKTCHRHLPPKPAAAKKRKLNNGEGSSSQAKSSKEPPKTMNDLRAKAAEWQKAAKKKRAEKRAAARAAARAVGKVAPTKGRPPKTPSDNGLQAASSRVRASQASQSASSMQARAPSAPQASQGSSSSSARIGANARNAGS